MEKEIEEFFNITQATKIIPVSKHTFRIYVNEGRYPPAYIGEKNQHYWRKSDLGLLIRLIEAGIWTPTTYWKDVAEILEPSPKTHTRD